MHYDHEYPDESDSRSVRRPDVVSRELVGMIPAVTVDASRNRAAVNENVRVPIAPANTAGGDITRLCPFPAEVDQTIGYTIAITKAPRFLPLWKRRRTTRFGTMVQLSWHPRQPDA